MLRIEFKDGDTPIDFNKISLLYRTTVDATAAVLKVPGEESLPLHLHWIDMIVDGVHVRVDFGSREDRDDMYDLAKQYMKSAL